VYNITERVNTGKSRSHPLTAARQFPCQRKQFSPRSVVSAELLFVFILGKPQTKLMHRKSLKYPASL
jgi:hypothetical protein